MDPVTHALFGAAIAQLGFRQRIGKDATWIAAGAALVPDLDIFIASVLSFAGTEHGDFAQIQFHRGITHSIFFCALVALVISAVWWKFKPADSSHTKYTLEGQTAVKSQSFPFQLLFGCTLLAVLSGPFLDLCTSYGTQLFAPLSDKRYALNAVSVVDLIFTSIIFLTLLLCFVLRKLLSKSANVTITIGWMGFILACTYLATGFVSGKYIVHKLRILERESNNQHFLVNYTAYPQPGSIFVWRVTKESHHLWQVAKINILFEQWDKSPTWNHAANVTNEWVRKAKQTPKIKLFYWFAANQVRSSGLIEDTNRIVEFEDIRYGTSPDSVESLWKARVVFDAEGKILRTEFVESFGSEDLMQAAKSAINEIRTQ